MEPVKHTIPCPFEVKSDTASVTFSLQGRLDSTNARESLNSFHTSLAAAKKTKLIVDLSQLSFIDDYGITILLSLKTACVSQNISFELANIPDSIRSLLDLHHFDKLLKRTSSPKSDYSQRKNIFITAGEATYKHLDDMSYMATFLGTSLFNTLQAIRRPRSLRWNDILIYMQRTGVDALPIVGLISFLLGLIMAFMSSVQLQQFGANIYVASLVSLSMTRELGPIMTCIIVAGRSGSAYAAEIGSMKISEEVDALYVMGFDPHFFLVMPKLIATLMVVPMLTLFSDLFAITGGMLVGIGMLDLTINSYISQTINTLDLFDVFWGVGKSALFAMLIAMIGCLRGFQVKGGADAVGRATTSAVVSSIFLIILTDSIFAVLLRYWD